MSNNENAIANLVGNVNTQLALVDTESNFERVFPVLEQAAKSDRFTEDEAGTLEKLDGKKSVSGVILGARLDIVIYPGLYNEGVAPDQQDKPVGGGAVSLCDPRSNAIRNACKGFQFTKRDNKPLFAESNQGPGVFKASLSILLYNPEADGFVHVRSWNGFNGVFANGACLDSLNSLIDETGSIPAVIDDELQCYTLNARTEPGYNGAVNAMFSITRAAADAKLRKAFGAVVEANDDEVNASIKKWLECADNPVSDETVAKAEAAWQLYNDLK